MQIQNHPHSVQRPDQIPGAQPNNFQAARNARLNSSLRSLGNNLYRLSYQTKAFFEDVGGFIINVLMFPLHGRLLMMNQIV